MITWHYWHRRTYILNEKSVQRKFSLDKESCFHFIQTLYEKLLDWADQKLIEKGILNGGEDAITTFLNLHEARRETLPSLIEKGDSDAAILYHILEESAPYYRMTKYDSYDKCRESSLLLVDYRNGEEIEEFRVEIFRGVLSWYGLADKTVQKYMQEILEATEAEMQMILQCYQKHPAWRQQATKDNWLGIPQNIIDCVMLSDLTNLTKAEAFIFEWLEYFRADSRRERFGSPFVLERIDDKLYLFMRQYKLPTDIISKLALGLGAIGIYAWDSIFPDQIEKGLCEVSAYYDGVLL